MDTVSIHELRVETLIGFYEWERRLPQTIQLDLEFGLPTSAAGRSDRLRDTIDYGAVVQRLRDALAGTHFVLLERLCEHVADILRDEFKSPWVRVAATKVGVMRGVRRVAVTIERGEK
jgi:7,8-dihydroneopterin aldolase/epimerase/oxygenase